MPSTPYNPTPDEIKAKLYANRPWDDASYVVSQLEAAGFSSVKTETIRQKASVGGADLFMESMQFPLMIVKMFWPEEKRDELLKELNGIMRKEVEEGYVKEDGKVEMGFEAICAWGWRE